MLNLSKIYDNPDTAYYLVGEELKRYSKCHISLQSYKQIDYNLQDIIICPSPNISYSETAIKIPQTCKEKGIKFIGQYSEEMDIVYDYADLIITTSPNQYIYAKEKYSNIPVIFLPESIDLNNFQTNEIEARRFTPGYFATNNNHPFTNPKIPIKILNTYDQEEFKNIDCLISFGNNNQRVLLQALACGLPILSTDIGPIHLFIPDDFIIKNLDEVYEQLENLRNDIYLRDGLSRINRAWCDKIWSWEQNIDLWDKTFYYLHTNKIDKILELSDNVVSSFQKYFESNEINKEQISNFSSVKIEKEKHYEPNKHEAKILKILQDLHSTNHKFWISKQTCLDTVKHKQLFTSENKLFIGVENGSTKVDLVAFLVNKGAKFSQNKTNPILNGIEVNIEIEPEVVNTKEILLQNQKLLSPYPVVPYLNDRFGYNWRNQ